MIYTSENKAFTVLYPWDFHLTSILPDKIGYSGVCQPHGNTISASHGLISIDILSLSPPSVAGPLYVSSFSSDGKLLQKSEPCGSLSEKRLSTTANVETLQFPYALHEHDPSVLYSCVSCIDSMPASAYPSLSGFTVGRGCKPLHVLGYVLLTPLWLHVKLHETSNTW